jgi:guanosine-3',5'-bis(diphosphate) 3'-pyrophosphohydrolase
MSQEMGLEQIFEAAIFAAFKHKGQVRKGKNKSPYITHPLLVAKAVHQIGGVSDILILTAAVLHDTIEDTKTTDAEISQRFGEDVLSLVRELTDDKTLEKAVRKRLQVVHAPHLSHEAKIIKLADKLMNCRDVLESPPKNWNLQRCQDYMQWAADVVAQMRGANANLEQAFDEVLSNAEQTLNFVIEPFDTVHQRPWAPLPSDHVDQE